jgi:YegS/Rv2252/BmrU family lipid kinase
MEKKKVMFIINLRAGIGRGKRCYRQVREWLDKNATESKIEPNFSFTEKTGERNAANLARIATQKRYDLLVVVGGDGTVNEVVNGLLGFDIPLLVVPAGNGNDFAKAIGTPKNTKKALDLINQGKVDLVDLGKVNGRFFVNVFGVGFDAKITRYAEALKEKWPLAPNTLLYLIALLRELLIKLEYLHLDVKFPRKKIFFETMPGKATLVLVANGYSCGGIFKLAPQADIRDGFLDICWIRKTSRLRIFRFIWKGIRGTHIGLPEVRKNSAGKLPRTTSLVISSLENQNIPCQMDGELPPVEKEYRISILPKALKIIVP